MKIFIRPIRIDGNVAYVPLTQGHEAIIDVDDVNLVENRNWCSSKGGKAFYAVSNKSRPDVGQFVMHQIIMPCPEGFVIDHIDGNGLNNTKSNLRIVTQSQNCMNRSIRSDNSSGIIGVRMRRETKKWVATIYKNGTSHYLGDFETIEKAAEARMIAEKKFFGKYRKK